MSDTQQGKCFICHGTFSPYPMGVKNDWRFVACQACGSVRVDPWPTPDEIEQFYADIEPNITHVANPDAEITRYKNLIQKMLPQPAGKTLISVAFKQGYVVEAAAQLGMQARGIDHHEFFYNFAKSKYPSRNFTHATAEEFAKTGATADLVFTDYVFCDNLDPDLLAQNLGRIMAPGGKLYLEEPSGNSFNLPRNFANWSFVDPPLNFLYMSKKGMEKLLARHGLKVEKSLFTWQPFMRLVVTKK